LISVASAGQCDVPSLEGKLPQCVPSCSNAVAVPSLCCYATEETCLWTDNVLPFVPQPVERVQAPVSARPIIICPGIAFNLLICFAAGNAALVLAGFANNSNDYLAPFGQEELGLAPHLQVA
jgi:hypothetical protein